MKKHVLMAPAGDDMDSVYQIVRTFPTDRIILLSDQNDIEKTREFSRSLRKFKIPVDTIKVRKYSIDELFKITKKIYEAEKEREVIISVASGSKTTACLTLSAAFVNGIKAVGIVNDRVVLMPVMRFSYYKAISEQKMRILKFLYRSPGYRRSLEEMRKSMKMSLPLISYHINGNQRVEGLVQMGLVESADKKSRRMTISLTELGEMMISGYI